MQITFCYRNMDVSEALQATATEKISRLTRYLSGMDHAEVSYFVQRNPRIASSVMCEVTLSGHGHHVRARASAPDAFATIDLVVDKLEHQLTKLKGKLAGHPHRHEKYRVKARSGEALSIPQLAPAKDATADISANGRGDETNVATFVKSKVLSVSAMSADDAALRMDLLQHDFYLFVNVETDRPALVYRRDDGNLGLIDVAVDLKSVRRSDQKAGAFS